MRQGRDELRTFLAAWPEFGDPGVIDELRAREFARLDASGQVYLDYTGAGLYGESQIRRHMDVLLTHVLGNPHSANPTSQLSTDFRAPDIPLSKSVRFFIGAAPRRPQI